MHVLPFLPVMLLLAALLRRPRTEPAPASQVHRAA
jgi:hypothetical protein